MNIGFNDVRFLVRVSYIKGKSGGNKLRFTVTRIFNPLLSEWEITEKSFSPDTEREEQRQTKRQLSEDKGQVVVLLWDTLCLMKRWFISFRTVILIRLIFFIHFFPPFEHHCTECPLLKCSEEVWKQSGSKVEIYQIWLKATLFWILIIIMSQNAHLFKY